MIGAMSVETTTTRVRDAEARDIAAIQAIYASLYRARSGYRYTLEDSVYVREAFGGRGIGEALLRALIARCSQGKWRQMIAVIGDSANAASIGLHRKLGFRHAGTLEAVGFKLGRWVDSVFMQRALRDGEKSLPD